jgi:YHS domain-containing protein
MKLEATDPICGMSVDPDSPLRADHAGTTYLFCSSSCRATFVQDPETHLHAPAAGSHHSEDHPHGGHSWRDYIPLLVIVTLTALAAAARQMAAGSWFTMSFMHDFMGFFLVVFSMFKFFDLPGFADGFQMYDLLARPFRPYAFLYPFLELALGLGYLARWESRVVYLATILLMGFGTLGVLRSLVRGQKVQCACLGTILQVPLSTVAVVENVGMVLMAALMLPAAR